MKAPQKETARRQNAEWKQLSRYLDVSWSYLLAKRMEQFKTNDTLGYRTAGSKAEFLTGELLAEEMRGIGLTVTKDEFTVDGWEFHHARLTYTGADGVEYTAELGGYQTNFDTHGKQEYTLINAGRGTEEELSGLDLTGKLALIEINQRDDWWINYPAYAAHLRGAAAVLAVQMKGYAEASARALNAQDICGPAKAAAFSLSKKDAKRLIADRQLAFGEETTILFDAKSTVLPATHTYNIVGKIEGRDPDAMLLVSAHYDSYFQGFQDDNTAVSLMLSLARAVKLSGYRPEKTMLFIAMAAEEWGVIDSRYDWSVGAWNELFRLHPDWPGRIIANINLELPAHAHGKQHKIRSVYEYRRFLQKQLRALPEPMAKLYPKGIGVVCPSETWSDDFSIAIAGVPSMVNEFGEGSFMETHYHSQYDNDGAYDEQVYLFHHLLYSRLLLAFDQTALPPLNFADRLVAFGESIQNQRLSPAFEGSLRKTLATCIDRAERLAAYTDERNETYASLLHKDPGLAAALQQDETDRRTDLLAAFRFCEDTFTRLDWGERAMFGHVACEQNLASLHRAAWQLAAGDAGAALRSLCEIDDNRYAAAFDEAVVEYFADRAQNQPADRLLWGAGRLTGRLPLRGLIEAIRTQAALPEPDFSQEIGELHTLQKKEQQHLEQLLREEGQGLAELAKLLKKMLPKGASIKPKREKKKKANGKKNKPKRTEE